jgi:hypothetical protein
MYISRNKLVFLLLLAVCVASVYLYKQNTYEGYRVRASGGGTGGDGGILGWVLLGIVGVALIFGVIAYFSSGLKTDSYNYRGNTNNYRTNGV